MKKICLYLDENQEINSYKGNNLLNKRSELINKCRELSKGKLYKSLSNVPTNIVSVSDCYFVGEYSKNSYWKNKAYLTIILTLHFDNAMRLL